MAIVVFLTLAYLAASGFVCVVMAVRAFVVILDARDFNHVVVSFIVGMLAYAMLALWGITLLLRYASVIVPPPGQ